jgi:UDP-3-O-[3-hydroxymyristoyl] glucosamine N-acyltransferase
MKFTTKQIAELLQGTVEGDENIELDRFSKIEQGESGGLSFLSNPKYTQYIYTTQASAVLVSNDFVPLRPIPATLIRVEDPYLSFAQLMHLYTKEKRKKSGISKMASIAATVILGKSPFIGDFSYIGNHTKIGDNVMIYPQVYIGENVTIGNDVILYPGVKIMDDTVIGNQCTFHPGCIIGADGFGFAPQSDKAYMKIPQLGNVVIEDNVDIGANTCIDRSTIGSTMIRKGVKLCNFIQIAHNCDIGENTVMAAQVGISGSTKIGKNCLFGGQVGVNWHVKIGDNVQVGAQSAIGNHVPDNAKVLGTPAFDVKDCVKLYARQRRIPELFDRVRDLEKKMEDKKD